MAQWLKQSTAATVKLGPFLDENDGKTAETGLTIGQADIRLSKNGGAFTQTNNAAGGTHDENGWYGVALDTTDTGTLGRLIVSIHESGALPVWHDFIVLPAHVYDGLVAGTDYMQVDAVQVEGADASDAVSVEITQESGATRTSAVEDTVTLYQGAALPAAALPDITDADGNAVDCSGFTMYFLAATLGVAFGEGDLFKIEDANITDGGDDGNEITVTYTSTHTATAGTYRWELWTSTKRLLGFGPLVIAPTVYDEAS